MTTARSLQGLISSAATAFAAGLLSCGLLSAQRAQPAPIERQPPPQQEGTSTLRLESRLVSLALNVSDEHGAPVSGLKADDFEIAEDNKPQRIAVFESESSTPRLPSGWRSTPAKACSMMSASSARRPRASCALHSAAPGSGRSYAVSRTTWMNLWPSRTNRAEWKAALSRLQHGDATALYDAVYLASQRLREVRSAPGQRKVLVLITDGENTTHHGAYDTALEQAQRAGGHDLRLDHRACGCRCRPQRRR